MSLVCDTLRGRLRTLGLLQEKVSIDGYETGHIFCFCASFSAWHYMSLQTRPCQSYGQGEKWGLPNVEQDDVSLFAFGGKEHTQSFRW